MILLFQLVVYTCIPWLQVDPKTKLIYCCDCSTELTKQTCFPKIWGDANIQYRCGACWAKKTSSKKQETSGKTSSKKQETSGKTSSKKKTPKKAKKTSEAPFKVGDTVSGKWSGDNCTGQWYTGTILAINLAKKTIHIKYEDGDEDKMLPWHDVSIPG